MPTQKRSMKNNTTSNIQIKNIKNEPTFKITYTKSLFLKENSNQPQTEKIISDYLLNSILLLLWGSWFQSGAPILHHMSGAQRITFVSQFPSSTICSGNWTQVVRFPQHSIILPTEPSHQALVNILESINLLPLTKIKFCLSTTKWLSSVSVWKKLLLWWIVKSSKITNK